MKNKRYDVITIGGATEDITFYTKEGVVVENKKDVLRQKLFAFEYGAKLKVDKSYSTFGGGAANAAVCLSTLGFKTAAIVAVGDDSRGQNIIANLKARGVDAGLVQIKKGIESGFSFLLVGQGSEHVVFSNRAANTRIEIKSAQIKEMEKSKWLYITSLSGKWQDVLKNIFKAKNVKIAWNPGHIQLHAGLKAIGAHLKKTEVVVLNKDEATELVLSESEFKNKDSRFLNNIKNLLSIIGACGPKITVITSGKYGADAFDGKKYYHQSVIKERERVDTTGVGDAFGATFVAGLEIYKGDIAKTMLLSAKNTASVISKQGAQNGFIKRGKF